MYKVKNFMGGRICRTATSGCPPVPHSFRYVRYNLMFFWGGRSTPRVEFGLMHGGSTQRKQDERSEVLKVVEIGR